MGYKTDGTVVTGPAGAAGSVVFNLTTSSGDIIKTYQVESRHADAFEKDLEAELPLIKSIHHSDDIRIVRNSLITG